MKQHHEKIVKELTDRMSKMLAEHIVPAEKALHEAPDEPARIGLTVVFKTEKDKETKTEAMVCVVTCKATLASARESIPASVSGGQLTLGF